MSYPNRPDAPLNPDREYEESTEDRLDQSRPAPHQAETEEAAIRKHEDGPQISVGKP